MNRDGATESIWQASSPEYRPSNAWQPGTVYDVVVVGAGITGITTALLLQQEGKKVLVAEAHTLCFGTTSGTTAHLNTFLDVPYYQIEQNFNEETAAETARCTRAAIDFISHQLHTLSAEAGFEYHPAYLFSTDEKETEELEKVRSSAVKYGVGMTPSSVLPMRIPFDKAYRVDLQAIVQPVDYVQALAKAFEEAGGVILEHCHVKEHREGEPMELDTTLGTIRCTDVVFATHIPPGLTHIHFSTAAYRSYVIAFPIQPGVYGEGLLYDMKDPYNYYRKHTIDGKEFMIVGGCDHKTGHGEPTESALQKLEAHARSLFPVEEPVYRWSSQYFIPADGMPYIGEMASHVYCATGFNGNGLIWGTVAGNLLCDLLTGKKHPLAEALSPKRIKPFAGLGDFIKENLDVAGQFIGKRFAYEQLNELAGLAPGEGKLVSYEGQKLAIYKDENGEVTALNPVCPHAKCIVSWNGAERSWDCPCHGGRFDTQGNVITGPARGPLERVFGKELKGD